MRMVRDVTSIDGAPYLAGLGLDPDDVGRLTVAEGFAGRTALYVNAETGESKFVTEGDPMPEGIWVANREIDDLRPAVDIERLTNAKGFGEGWGVQAEQFGGDRSYPEEDVGGTRRVPHAGVSEDVDPFVGDASG